MEPLVQARRVSVSVPLDGKDSSAIDPAVTTPTVYNVLNSVLAKMERLVIRKMELVPVEQDTLVSFAKINANREILVLTANKNANAKKEITLAVTQSVANAFVDPTGKVCDAKLDVHLVNSDPLAKTVATARTTVLAIQNLESATAPGVGKAKIVVSRATKAIMVLDVNKLAHSSQWVIKPAIISPGSMFVLPVTSASRANTLVPSELTARIARAIALAGMVEIAITSLASVSACQDGSARTAQFRASRDDSA
jgi:hypothetical protein